MNCRSPLEFRRFKLRINPRVYTVHHQLSTGLKFLKRTQWSVSSSGSSSPETIEEELGRREGKGRRCCLGGGGRT